MPGRTGTDGLSGSGRVSAETPLTPDNLAGVPGPHSGRLDSWLDGAQHAEAPQGERGLPNFEGPARQSGQEGLAGFDGPSHHPSAPVQHVVTGDGRGAGAPPPSHEVSEQGHDGAGQNVASGSANRGGPGPSAMESVRSSHPDVRSDGGPRAPVREVQSDGGPQSARPVEETGQGGSQTAHSGPDEGVRQVHDAPEQGVVDQSSRSEGQGTYQEEGGAPGGLAGAPVGTGASPRPAETAPRGTGPTARERQAEQAEDVTDAAGGRQIERYPGFEETNGPWQPVASPVERGGGLSASGPSGTRSVDAPSASAGGPPSNGARGAATGPGGAQLPGQGLVREAPGGVFGRTGTSRAGAGSGTGPGSGSGLGAPRLSSDRPSVSPEGPAQGSTRPGASGASEAGTRDSAGQSPAAGGGTERTRQTRPAAGIGARRSQDDETPVNTENTENTENTASSSSEPSVIDDADSVGRRAETAATSVAGDTPHEEFRAPDAPTHDPGESNPLRDAPDAPNTPLTGMAEMGEGLAQRSDALDQVARESGMGRGIRRGFTDDIDEAIAGRQWTSAVDHLSAFRQATGAYVLDQRLRAFDSHIEHGFDRFEKLGADRAEWQAKVDAVQEAQRGDDLDRMDVALRDYTNFVEQQLPAEVLTGRDAAQPYDAVLEDLRRELAQTSDPRRARDIGSELNELLDTAEIRDRLDQLRQDRTDEVETALLRRIENAATQEQAARAMEQLEQHRAERELQNRLDSIFADEAEETGTGSGHTPVSDDELQARFDKLKGDQDDHARGLQARVDGDDAQDAARALEELREYRADQGLQDRLERLKLGAEREAPPSEEELTGRLHALGEGHDDRRTAQLRKELRDAPGRAEAERRYDALQKHLDRLEKDRLKNIGQLRGKIEELQDQRNDALVDAMPRVPSRDPGADTEDAGAGRGIGEPPERRPDPESGTVAELQSRIDGLREQLDAALTQREHQQALDEELSRPVERPDDGRLDRIVDEGLGRDEDRGDGSPDSSGEAALSQLPSLDDLLKDEGLSGAARDSSEDGDGLGLPSLDDFLEDKDLSGSPGGRSDDDAPSEAPGGAGLAEPVGGSRPASGPTGSGARAGDGVPARNSREPEGPATRNEPGDAVPGEQLRMAERKP
ncbi:hypothetical protein ACFU99_37750, partial [Streptomyces sp. NPDC057654]